MYLLLSHYLYLSLHGIENKMFKFYIVIDLCIFNATHHTNSMAINSVIVIKIR